MQHCCVVHCKNNKNVDNNVVFYRFPVRDVELCNRWATLLNVPVKNTSTVFVCEQHFSPDDFFKTRKSNEKKRLKRGRIPSRNLPRRQALHSNKNNKLKPELVHPIPNKMRIIQEKSPVLQAVGLERQNNIQIQPILNHKVNNLYSTTKIVSIREASPSTQTRPPVNVTQEPSTRFTNSRFAKLLNETSNFFAEISRDIERSEVFIEQSLAKNSKHSLSDSTRDKNIIVKEYKPAFDMSTVQCSEKLSRIVDNLYDVVLPEESMACSEENHKGTQTRICTLDKSVQTELAEKEAKLRAENDELKRRVHTLMSTVNNLRKQQPNNHKFLYLYKP